MMNIFLKYWHFSPISIFLLVLICFFGLYFVRDKRGPKIWRFLLALALTVIATCSPLHWMGMHYLFSAHMISHITLFLLVPPLLILSISFRKKSATGKVLIKISKHIATVPWLAWILGIGIMWFWHIPIVFNHAMSVHSVGMSAFLYHLQSLSLVLVGLLFWWPVLGPIAIYRISALKGVLYLFTACIGCSILGLLITFSPVGIYATYLNIPDAYGLSSVIRNNWGLSAARDQQIAGLIMWVPGCIIYLSVALYLIKKWFKEKDELSVATKVLNFDELNPYLHEEKKEKIK